MTCAKAILPILGTLFLTCVGGRAVTSHPGEEGGKGLSADWSPYHPIYGCQVSPQDGYTAMHVDWLEGQLNQGRSFVQSDAPLMKSAPEAVSKEAFIMIFSQTDRLKSPEPRKSLKEHLPRRGDEGRCFV